ncbi:MAG: DNA lyase, partial [Candidatus Aenigmatarchaeota archaeon]
QDSKFKIKEVLEKTKDDFELRRWLIKNVDGFGMKEASHFMRNVGRGQNIAILDRHVLRNLQKYGVIEKIPDVLTEKRYVEIEDEMRDFAKTSRIPLADLDLLFWSKETGFIFK